MKIQYIAVVFVIIIMPIALVISSYIGTQIDTIDLQVEYNTKLNDSTYDAVKAFQINTVNNRYSSISNSKIRDIQAAVNTFYNALANNEQLSQEALRDYVPALVFTLYDGYYIHSKYDNVYANVEADGQVTTTNDGRPITDGNELKDDAYTNYGLKPYIYYSCRYIGNNKDFVVNYTLDNAITLYGVFGIGQSYQTLSGYLIDYTAVQDITYSEEEPRNWKLTYDGVTITPEILTEYVLFDDGTGGNYEYLTYNGQKIYREAEGRYFWYQNYGKTYINDQTTKNYALERDWGGHLHSTSSFEYYYQAYNFSKQVATLTKGISQKDAVDEEGNPIAVGQDASNHFTGFPVDTGEEDIFVTSKENNPLLSSSTFNENRMAVIRRSIQTNLTTAIANYNLYSSNNYEFSLPVLDEVDWEKITNNVSMISFLQGIPIGHKYYNNYCVITNDENEEVVEKDNIYLVTQNASGQREYHLPGCKELMKSQASTGLTIKEAYSNLSFLRQTVRIAEGDYIYFYPQMRTTGEQITTITACYHCIVNAADLYQVDDIIHGVIYSRENNDDWENEAIFRVETNARLKEVRDFYITALGRERYDLYQVNMDAFNQ